MSYNRLTSLNGIDFSLFRQLEIFDISNNKITSLGNIYEATSLRTLLLENNELENIPLELCYLSNLQTLSLHGNPQRTVRQAIIQKGVLAILAVRSNYYYLSIIILFLFYFCIYSLFKVN